MHPDVFVGDTALWWLEDRKAETPLFLQIGFPGPHPPYDPTARHLELYRDADIPVPDVSDAEIAAQPRGQAELRRNMIERNMDAIVWKEHPPAEELLRLRRYYAANVTMIDEKVGQILEVLERRGYLENALVIFTSDHGDALGDHGHIQKWTMYDTVVRVPLLLWAPGRVDAGQKVDDLVQLMDIAPTVLDAAGVPVPDTFEARSLTPYLRGRPETPVRDVVHAELARDHIQTGSEYILMRRDQRYKLVWYLGEDEGELYDLETDPGEVRNLWHDPAQRARRDTMVDAAKDWSIRGLLETRRPPAAAAPRLPTLNR
jgi:arylsulfatase A-like enzyme